MTQPKETWKQQKLWLLTILIWFIARTGRENTLHLAAAGGHMDVAEFLLVNNADVNAKDNNGCTPLLLAVAKGHKDVAELLLTNKADVNAKASMGWTPLHYAAMTCRCRTWRNCCWTTAQM